MTDLLYFEEKLHARHLNSDMLSLKFKNKAKLYLKSQFFLPNVGTYVWKKSMS